MSKGLLNYTTKIKPSKTISEIQEILAKNGAKAVLANYNDVGEIKTLSFQIDINGQQIGVRLPCDRKPVLEVLRQQADARKIPRHFANEEQALKVAWRIVKVWVDAQMAINQTKMVKMEQIFLPYMVTKNGETLYESLKESGFKMLSSGDEVNDKK